ncbi:MAG: sulfur carrier protein ThiS [Desulfobacteraceae bacterium]|nr:sulfur carrier protein ThiS [Desulfobacteraceae bacterium]
MKIIVNGEDRQAPPGITVAAYVATLGFDPETVVVELDGQILGRFEYDERRLAEGAELELIRFVGGG